MTVEGQLRQAIRQYVSGWEKYYIELPGVETDHWKIPPIHMYKSTRTVAERLGNVANRLVAIENQRTSSSKLMEMVRWRLLQEQDEKDVIIHQ